MDHLILPKHIYQQIMDTIGAFPFESGGALAVRGNTVSEYYFDVHAGVNKRFYRPSAERITEKGNQWIQAGMAFGFIHSHSPNHIHLSPMDIVTADMTICINGLSFLYMAVICEGKLYFYKVIAQPEQEHSALEECTFAIAD